MSYKIKIGVGKIMGLIAVAVFIGILSYYSSPNDKFDFKSLPTAPEEFWNLFPNTIQKKMSVVQTTVLKFQNPISDFIFDDEKYFIKVFKLDVSNIQSLDDFITLSNSKELMYNAIRYFNMGGRIFDVNYKTGKNKAFHVNLNLYGKDEKTIIKNDSVACFHSNFKIFSVNYNNSDTTAIYAMTEGRVTDIPTLSLPVDIMFVKKKGAVYLMVMSVNDPNVKMVAGKLYDLTRGIDK